MRLACIRCTEIAEGDDADVLLDWYNAHKALHEAEE